MFNKIIKLPTWKVYLYTFAQRFKIYRALTLGRINLGLRKGEKYLLRKMVYKYLTKGVINRQTKPIIYDKLVDSVLILNKHVAEKEEIELATKLLWIKQLNVKEILMELKDIQKFGKEVGLNVLAIRKMDEKELISAIVKAVDPSKHYSEEFIAWYDKEIPEEYFDAAEAISTGGTTTVPTGTGEPTGTALTDTSELIEVVNSLTKKDEMMQIVNDKDFAAFFVGFDVSKYKLAPQLKKAMIEQLNKPIATEVTAGATIEVDEETRLTLIEIINEISNEDELIKFLSDDEVMALFASIEFGDVIDVNIIKTQMLSMLGVEEIKEEKPLSLKERLALAKGGGKEVKEEESTSGSGITFDPTNFDPESIYTQASKLPFPKMRTFAKELEIVAPPGTKKEALLDLIGEKLVALVEGAIATESSEIEITVEMVNELVKTNDLDSLVTACEILGIQVNALVKKSAKTMGDKLIKAIGEKSVETKIAQTDVSTPGTENQSVYQMVEELVKGGGDEKVVAEAITPFYKSRNKNLLYIKQRAKMLTEIVKADYDL